MAEHYDDRTQDDGTAHHEADTLNRRERPDGMPRQPRPAHDDVGRAEAAGRSRWRFSSAVEAARHLGSR